MKPALIILLILAVSASATVQNLEVGAYLLFSNLTGQVVEVYQNSTEENAPITTAPLHLRTHQLFVLVTLPDSWKVMVCLNTRKMMIGVPNKSKGDVDITQMSPSPGATNLMWQFVPQPHGLYAIQSRSSGKYLTVREHAGDHLYQSEFDNKPHQLFRVFKIDEDRRPVKDGSIYYWFSMYNTYVLDVKDSSTENGAKLTINPFDGQQNEYFSTQKVDDEYYKIICVRSGKALSVDLNNRGAGSEIIQRDVTGGDEQLWKFVVQEHSSYNIRNKLTGMNMQTPLIIGEAITQAAADSKNDRQQWSNIEIL